MSERLHRYQRRLAPAERAAVLDGGTPVGAKPRLVARADGEPIDISALDALMTDFGSRQGHGEWPERSTSDRWLAPRVHFALRISRTVAADQGVWEWLALRYSAYTLWRWADDGSSVADERWHGAVNKQTFARLWWGAELFRDGADYTPVVRAFVRQDLINSYLHRPLVRCRSLALGILDVVAPAHDPTSRSAKDVNALARVLNLATAGAPPELETEFQRDDSAALAAWAAGDPEIPSGWGDLPAGPAASDTTSESRAGGLAVAQRGWGYASGVT
jgi:hypothetical protein